MSTLQYHRRISRPAPGTLLASAALIIIVAIGAVFLTLNSAKHTDTTPTTHTQTPSPYLPTIQTHAGAAHIVVNPRTGQAHGTVTPPQTHTQTPSPYLPAIQTHDAGVAHTVLDPRPGEAHITVTPPTNANVSNLGHRG